MKKNAECGMRNAERKSTSLLSADDFDFEFNSAFRTPHSAFSLYIHIPFCAGKCDYCDFYSVALRDAVLCDSSVMFDDYYPTVHDNDHSIIDKYIDALAEEWEFYIDCGIVDNTTIRTIYIGGGTPSILSVDMWQTLDEKLLSRIDKSAIKEFSVECNPESFTMEKAQTYAQSGVTRLTFGIQSLNDNELQLCGRAHNAKTAYDVLSDDRLPQIFKSVGADIIYGLPNQTISTLTETITRILSIPHVQHLSAYELTVADDTPFGHNRDQLKLPDDETIAKMYYRIADICADHNLAQYEVSNYARSGFESLHNMAYWSHNAYIGLGAAAHSYIHPKRMSNVDDASQYISKILQDGANNHIRANAVNFEETLTTHDISSEIIFLGLRNIGGIDELLYEKLVGQKFLNDRREKHLQKFINAELLSKQNQKWIPTSKGMLFADMMARELIGR